MRALWGLIAAVVLISACRCNEKKPASRPATAPPEAAAAPNPTPPAQPRRVEPRPPATRPRPTPTPMRRTPPGDTPRPRVTVKVSPGPTRSDPGFRLRGGRIDIDVHRTDVRHLLQSIARATGTNIVLFPEVTGRVTVQLRNQPLGAAVAVVARAVGCTARSSGRMLIVRCK